MIYYYYFANRRAVKWTSRASPPPAKTRQDDCWIAASCVACALLLVDVGAAELRLSALILL